MKNKKTYLTIAIIIVILIGTLFAATKSTPENILYPIKLNVVEKLVGLTKRDDLAKANYSLSLGEKRLVELQELKDKNLLDSDMGNRVRDNFNQQTILVQSIIGSLSREKGVDSLQVLQLSEILNVQIEQAKEIWNIDQLEVLPEGAPLPKDSKASTTK